VSFTGPERLVQSTGNLYWTANVLNEFGRSTSTVYRTGKLDRPGQEHALYRLSHGGEIHFGALTYAQVGTWYGYVVVNDRSTSRSQIRRVPLAGGPAVTLTTSPRSIGGRDLTTDGRTLFWADEGGLRSMPIGGGPVRTLVAGAGITSVGLDATSIYFTAGTTVRRVPQGGGATTLVVSAPSAVTALFVERNLGTIVYWGERNGSVKSRVAGTTGTTVHQGPTTGRHVRSVTSPGAPVLWTDCSSAGNACRTVRRSGGTTRVLAGGQVGASDVQTDGARAFWGTASRVLRYAF
jgi:hypothetical protein